MDQEYYLEMAAAEDEHWWFVARRRIIERVLDSLRLDGENDILEVGCGSGGNLQLLSQYGNVYGTDPGATAIEVANKRKIAQVESGALPDNLPFGAKRFDLIAMLDVLEHIDDDLASLNALRKRLKPNGKLLLTVPAYQFLWSKHDVFFHHKRRYLRSQVEWAIDKSGFHVTYSTYFNTILFPVVAATRLMNNIIGKENSSDIKMPPKILNTMLTWIFGSESLFIPRISFPYGVSILVVAQVDE